MVAPPNGPLIWYPGSDLVIHFYDGYTIDLTTGLPWYLNAAATVQFTVQTAEYVNIPGQNWPADMTWVSGSQGHFIGVLSAAAEGVPNTEYRLITTGFNGMNQLGSWDMPLHARERF